MVKITTCMSMLVLMLSAQFLTAQTEKDSLKLEVETRKETANNYKQVTIDNLTKKKEAIILEEKEKLKTAVKEIQEKEDKGEITPVEAQNQKAEAAKLAAQNIENKTAIIDNSIALAERGEYYEVNTGPEYLGVTIGADSGEENKFLGVSIFTDKTENKELKYDKKTRTDLVIAFGLNNAIIEGEGIDGSPYEIGGSRFFEIGYMWSTRVLENSNYIRFRYGLSFQYNGLNPTDNKYFVDEGDETVLKEHSSNLKKAKLRMDNLIAPIFFEFGPSKKKVRDTYFRYSTVNQFKFGIGGYAGLNYSTRQKLKYKEDGNRQKDKFKNNYNTNNFVYGLAGYIGIDDMSIYVKYDLNPIFHNADVKQNNISLGVRWDL
ncbi:hypothetical protein SAMN05216480_10590 [Pustulibacterium marinum]|uniref:Outer membrane protein beta-barrel domain-containing protein n=1 Tax=Pustulibacterium marinum TaxID=1224947 RepID=A0A1I7GMH6_9FLAO|nr:hypothetical protein [Pustulibacterium marinum]SFU49648.1 hypothetical protein SAMN05216480_10590 [Pustulibacterium marinum]